jgi:hypothetical protein
MEKVQIIPPPKDVDPRNLAWKGGCVLAKMDSVNEMWVTPADWVRISLPVLLQFFPFVWVCPTSICGDLIWRFLFCSIGVGVGGALTRMGLNGRATDCFTHATSALILHPRFSYHSSSIFRRQKGSSFHNTPHPPLVPNYRDDRERALFRNASAFAILNLFQGLTGTDFSNFIGQVRA